MKQLIGTIIALVFGIVLIVLGFVTKHKQSDYTETTATITNIETEPGAGDEADSHRVFVKYTVDGKEYNEELDNYKSSYSVGDTIKVKYNPENPSDVTSSGYFVVIILFVIGGILTLGSGIYLIAGTFFLFKK